MALYCRHSGTEKRLIQIKCCFIDIFTVSTKRQHIERNAGTYLANPVSVMQELKYLRLITTLSLSCNIK
jgi:hypothetical protein